MLETGTNEVDISKEMIFMYKVIFSEVVPLEFINDTGNTLLP